MEDYEFLTKIGSGSYGNVYKVYDHAKKQFRAVKKFKQEYKSVQKCKKEVEVTLLPKLKHNNIVTLHKVVYHNEALYLVMELAKTDLGSFLKKTRKDGGRLTEEQIRKFMKQIVAGVQYMHSVGFMHRDLKPENILVSEDNTLKITDVGTAKDVKDEFPYTNYVSTRWYRAPECVLNMTQYDASVDVFALGWIMVELYLLKPMFWGSTSLDQLTKYIKVLGTTEFMHWKEGVKVAQNLGFEAPSYEPEWLSEKLSYASVDSLDLIKSLLKFEPEKRININEILNHPFFGSKGATSKLLRNATLQHDISAKKLVSNLMMKIIMYLES